MDIMNTIKRVGEVSYINQYIFILHFPYADNARNTSMFSTMHYFKLSF